MDGLYPQSFVYDFLHSHHNFSVGFRSGLSANHIDEFVCFSEEKFKSSLLTEKIHYPPEKCQHNQQSWGIRGVTVIVVENGHEDTSSKPGGD